MAGLDPLIGLIYHERQQDGSMLCAQHALNSLLQSNLFTAPDLSSIANKLDEMERSVHTQGGNRESGNMDDTGFFSVQVINDALHLWGLRMVHWRSPEMQAYQEFPYQQFAFILNLEQHWFTIRRFGVVNEVENATAEEAEKCHWFNLNSFLETPEWIGRLYLGMMLQQAEQEGYSVYAIRRIDQETPLPMLRTIPDEVASTLPQPTSSGNTQLSTGRVPSTTGITNPGPLSGIEGFEDEDMELQAALQASLMSGDPTQLTTPGLAMPGSFTDTPSTTPPGGFSAPRYGASFDPSHVESSMARSRAMMDQMRRHQEAALRDTYDSEVRQRFVTSSRNPYEAPENTGRTESSRRTRGEEEEEEAIQKAIEASRVDPTSIVSDDSDDEDFSPPQAQRVQPSNPQRFAEHTGVYDDDDAELQAALRASLEGMPQGAAVPETPSIPVRPRGTVTGASSLARPSAPVSKPSGSEGAEEEYEEESEGEVTEETPQPAPPPAISEAMDVDEMRKRRLARFGG